MCPNCGDHGDCDCGQYSDNKFHRQMLPQDDADYQEHEADRPYPGEFHLSDPLRPPFIADSLLSLHHHLADNRANARADQTIL